MPKLVCMARKVVTLKARVPTNWTTLAHQSIRRGSKASERNRREPALAPGPPIGVEGFQALEPRSGREEDGSNEEHDRVRRRPDRLDESSEGADEEAGRADCEQHSDPPRRPVWGPLDAFGSPRPGEQGVVLPLVPRRPLGDSSVGPSVGDVRGEGADGPFADARPTRRRLWVGDHAPIKEAWARTDGARPGLPG